MNSQTMQNDTNNSELNSLTLPYCNYTNSLSFSKLLENVIMAAKSKSNQGKSELSHQEPLANVTAKATQKGNSCCTHKSSGDVPRTPLSDGYSWRKYGQKQVKGSGSSRSYYRCSLLSCCVKKKVQHLDSSGEVIDVVYQGDHNHVPPEKLRGTSQKEESALCASQNSSDSFLQNLDASRSLASEGELKQLVPSTYESQDRNPNSADGTLRKDVTEKHSKIADSVSRPESEPARVPTLEEHSGTRSNNPNELAITDPMKVLAVAPSKKRRIEERGKASSELVYRTSKDPKVVVIADTKVGLSSDGYRWRKYGQKMVKGNPHPRSYYRCSSVGCPVRKHVERATDNPTTFVVTYEGKHEHDIPTPKCYHHLASPDAPVSDADIPTPKRHHQLASPNAMASDANTVLEKSEKKSLSQLSAEEQSKDVDRNPAKDQKVSENGGDKVLESAQTLLSMGNELKSS